MSLTGAPATERAGLLSQYPSADAPDSRMSVDLVYQLALTRAEAGQYDRALALFVNRFFPSEEGGITSGQVLFEIKLLQAEAWARGSGCAQAEDFVSSTQMGAGLSPRDDVKLAGIAHSCANAQESEQFLRKAAASAEPANLVWAIQAKESLGSYDARQVEEQVANSLTAAQHQMAAGAHSASWWYNLGLLQAALHRNQEARQSFQQVLLLPDPQMFHHFAREALAELSAVKQAGL
jgi:tetratricopeptide (TPR) repeat protein